MAKKLTGSYRRERLHRVKSSDITLTEKAKKELENLKKRPIDLSDPDAPEITDWSNAIVGKFYRPIKKQITIRIDVDILEWFKHQPEKYQKLINNACRQYMNKYKDSD